MLNLRHCMAVFEIPDAKRSIGRFRKRRNESSSGKGQHKTVREGVRQWMRIRLWLRLTQRCKIRKEKEQERTVAITTKFLRDISVQSSLIKKILINLLNKLTGLLKRLDVFIRLISGFFPFNILVISVGDNDSISDSLQSELVFFKSGKRTNIGGNSAVLSKSITLISVSASVDLSCSFPRLEGN